MYTHPATINAVFRGQKFAFSIFKKFSPLKYRGDDGKAFGSSIDIDIKGKFVQ
jgi:hypothetical protein